MRKIIDGHVHISRWHPLPWTDPLTGNVRLERGMLIGGNGVPRRSLPSYFTDSCYPVDSLIATLDENGVEKAAIMAHLDSEICETALEAQSRYPDRLAAAVSFPPKAESAELLKQWNDKGIHLLKFEMRGMEETFPGTTVETPELAAIIDAADERGMTLTVDPSPAGFPCYRPDCMSRMIAKHPGLKVVICHLGLPYKGIEKNGEVFAKWKEMVLLAKHPNVFLDVTAIPDLYVEENYPYPSAMELFRFVFEEVGPKKFIWGTDIPGSFRNATYYQMIQAFERLDFLTEQDKDDLFYNNANYVYFGIPR